MSEKKSVGFHLYFNTYMCREHYGRVSDRRTYEKDDGYSGSYFLGILDRDLAEIQGVFDKHALPELSDDEIEMLQSIVEDNDDAPELVADADHALQRIKNGFAQTVAQSIELKFKLPCSEDEHIHEITLNYLRNFKIPKFGGQKFTVESARLSIKIGDNQDMRSIKVSDKDVLWAFRTNAARDIASPEFLSVLKTIIPETAEANRDAWEQAIAEIGSYEVN